MANPHHGSTLDSLFEELGERDDVEALTKAKIASLGHEPQDPADDEIGVAVQWAPGVGFVRRS